MPGSSVRPAAGTARRWIYRIRLGVTECRAFFADRGRLAGSQPAFAALHLAGTSMDAALLPIISLQDGECRVKTCIRTRDAGLTRMDDDGLPRADLRQHHGQAIRMLVRATREKRDTRQPGQAAFVSRNSVTYGSPVHFCSGRAESRTGRLGPEECAHGDDDHTEFL